METMEAYYKSVFAPVNEDTLAGGLSNTIAGRICNFLDFHGGGYTVDGAFSAEDALDKAANTVYNMAFLDINMPGMEGIELIEHLRERCPDVEIVMLTGYGTDDKNAAARQKGIMDFLEKIGPSGDRVLGEEMVDLADEAFEKMQQ